MRELKVGMKAYHVYADPEEPVEIWEYIIRTIQRKRRKSWQKYDIMPVMVYMVHKDTHTWVKLSHKSGDYGWSPNLAECDYTTFQMDEYEKNGLPSGYSFTKSGAYQKAFQDAKKRLVKIKKELNDEHEDDIPDAMEEIKLQEKLVSKLKGLHTKSKK